MAIGILLVGGKGTRLQPLTNEIPKPMLPIGGIPVTEHQLLAAKRAGITTVILATSYLSEIFTPYFGDGSKWGMNLIYAQEDQPLGTGGAIRNAAQALKRERKSEEFVIFNGDVISSHNIQNQLEFHRAHNAEVTLHLIEVKDARAFGSVPTDEAGRVTAFLEKMDNPISSAVNAGCYIFAPEIINEIPEGKVVSVEREIFPKLVSDGRALFGYKEDSYWLDIGTPAALFQGSRDAVSADFAVGAESLVGDGSRLIGGTSVGKQVRIGKNVMISNSIICDQVKIGDGAQITDSFIFTGTEIENDAKITSRYLSPRQNEAILRE